MRTTGLLIEATLVAAVAVAAGCAGDAAVPPLGTDHPANASADTLPLTASSTTLARMTTTPTAPTTAPAAPAAPTPATLPATLPASGAAVYVCPMHPEVTSTDAKARCPICTMRLELPKQKGAAR